MMVAGSRLMTPGPSGEGKKRQGIRAETGGRTGFTSMRLGYGEGVTHDYQRHGTNNLVRRPQPAQRRGHRPMQTPPSSSGVPRLPASHRDQCADQLDVHLVVDNYATHKHPKVRAWLARCPRWHGNLCLLAQASRTLRCPHRRTHHPARPLDSNADLVKNRPVRPHP
jgi:hypothetical protein